MIGFFFILYLNWYLLLKQCNLDFWILVSSFVLLVIFAEGKTLIHHIFIFMLCYFPLCFPHLNFLRSGQAQTISTL